MTIPSLTLMIYIITSGVFISHLFIRNSIVIRISRALFLACVSLHLISIILLGKHIHQLPLASIPQAINMMVFFASVIFIPIVFRGSTFVLGVFFIPAAAFALSLVLPFTGSSPGPVFNPYQPWYPLHTLSVVIGEALFGVAAITSVAYLIHERIIKNGDIHSRGSNLPALSILDTLLYSALTLGFIAITIGMIVGALWAAALRLDLYNIAPKAVTGAVTWIIFAVCIHQRFAIGWRGRRTAIITLIGFSCMVFLLIGIRFLFPGAHGTGLLP